MKFHFTDFTKWDTIVYERTNIFKSDTGCCDELNLATIVAMNLMVSSALDSVSWPFDYADRADLVSLFDGGGGGVFAVCGLSWHGVPGFSNPSILLTASQFPDFLHTQKEWRHFIWGSRSALPCGRLPPSRIWFATKYLRQGHVNVSEFSNCRRTDATNSYDSFLTISALVEKDSILTDISLAAVQPLKYDNFNRFCHFPWAWMLWLSLVVSEPNRGHCI